MTAHEDADRALNRVAKWRGLFAGWQVGTRPKGDPVADAIRDHREATILLRVEVSALVALLVEKGVFDADEWCTQLVVEADALNRMYEEKFPGVRADDNGLIIDRRALPWMKGWPE